MSLFFYFYVGFDEGVFALSVGLIIEALISWPDYVGGVTTLSFYC